tara:strand:- start:229 stop:342 length:114 start_codon:yes stop_codon:yes gene_type:complete
MVSLAINGLKNETNTVAVEWNPKFAENKSMNKPRKKA